MNWRERRLTPFISSNIPFRKGGSLSRHGDERRLLTSSDLVNNPLFLLRFVFFIAQETL